MDSKTAGVGFVLALIAFALVAVLTTGWTCGKVTIGSMEVCASSLNNVTAAVSATSGATNGNYDSLDYPLGTSFLTDPGANNGWDLSLLEMTVGAAVVTVQYGYGQTHVEDSAGAPFQSQTLGEVVFPANSGVVQHPVTGRVPGGMYPWVRVSGPATWPSRVTLTGLAR